MPLFTHSIYRSSVVFHTFSYFTTLKYFIEVYVHHVKVFTVATKIDILLCCNFTCSLYYFTLFPVTNHFIFLVPSHNPGLNVMKEDEGFSVSSLCLDIFLKKSFSSCLRFGNVYCQHFSCEILMN